MSLFREVFHIVIDVPELDINRHCPSNGVLVLLKDHNEEVVVDVVQVKFALLLLLICRIPVRRLTILNAHDLHLMIARWWRDNYLLGVFN